MSSGNTDGTAKAWEHFFTDVNRLTTTAAVYWSGILLGAALLILLWSRGTADHLAYGLVVRCGRPSSAPEWPSA